MTAKRVRAFFSSTLLLGAGSVIHALRVIVLSFLLGNRDFGAVSTILLISTLFAEFGSLGFSQIVYNQRLYTPRILNSASVNVARFLATGLSIISSMAVLTALAISSATRFQFVPLLATLACAGANTMLLASFRASNSKFTHPLGYFLKSLIVLVDIAVLGLGFFEIESIVLWGEILSTPVLLVYAWHSGIFRLRWSIFRRLPGVAGANRAVALWAVVSSMSALLFLNQERLAGALFLDLEQMGVITKIILIKIIGAQSAFIFGTYFHRHVVGSGNEGRSRTLSQIRAYEIYAYLALFAISIAMLIPVKRAYMVFYDITLGYAATLSALLLAIVFFFNPFAILLQASGRFGTIALCNAIAVGLFTALVFFSSGNSYVVVASAGTSLLWYVLVRRAACKLF